MRRFYRTFWTFSLGLLLAVGLSFLAPTPVHASTTVNLYAPVSVAAAKAGKPATVLLTDPNSKGIITLDTPFSSVLDNPAFQYSDLATYSIDFTYANDLGNNDFTFDDVYVLSLRADPTAKPIPEYVQSLHERFQTLTDQFQGYVVTAANQKVFLVSHPQWSVDHQTLNYYMQAEKCTGATTAVFHDETTTTPTTKKFRLMGLADTHANFVVGASRVPFDPTTAKIVDATGDSVSLISENFTEDFGVPFNEVLPVPLDGQATHTYTIIPKDDSVVLVHYQYADGKTAQADQLYHGPVDSSTTITAPAIDGYTPDQAALTPTFTAAKQELTFTYQKNPDPVTPPASSASESSASDSSASVSTSSESSTTSTSSNTTSSVTSSATTSSSTPAPVNRPTTPTSSVTTTSSSSAQSSTTPSSNANQATFKPFKLYVKHNLYAYRHPTFKTSQRVKHYVKRPRVKAQTLTVVGTARSKQGLLRYQLANGTYITAQPRFVANLYWQGIHSTKLTVTNPKGAYLYWKTSFTQKNRRKFLKPGTTVKVKKLVHHGMTTRYQLTNGQYLTGNKRFVSPVLK
ncbi:DUF5776 domain-containing protein [Levilactobacillus namurensis]|uniref:DUF5776 domain-containing protein n=1 Tax=Levilactobacillus namurensis TaxID=380393 RepID=A0AAW8W4J1_9LACO|nr:DUF5776 domain-containing protein [Levilactobacillus namurensis]MDT7013658.1 DUF5776 domain-containing protein [Levilactobacillus namurensis]